MVLKKIYLHYITPRTSEVLEWLHATFGAAQAWGGITLEPTVLKSGHEWALGQNIKAWGDPTPCVWMTEKVYLMYKLRWL